MYGWRGRVGVILPADNTVVEPEFARVLPDGVTAHAVRLSTGDQRAEMPVEAVSVAPAFMHADISVIGYMCAASSFLLGREGNEKLIGDISRATGGTPAFTASTAMASAFHVLGLKRVAILSPHPPAIASRLGDYVEAEGVHVTALRALDMTLRDINSQGPEAVYRAVLALDTSAADGVFVAATNFRALDAVEALEERLRIPVITSNQVCLFAALSQLGVGPSEIGIGTLMRDQAGSATRAAVGPASATAPH